MPHAGALGSKAIDRKGMSISMVQQPADDHLPVAHVVFFDLRALAHPAQLDERVTGIALVLGADDVVLIRGVDDAELGEPRSDRVRSKDSIRRSRSQSWPERAWLGPDSRRLPHGV